MIVSTKCSKTPSSTHMPKLSCCIPSCAAAFKINNNKLTSNFVLSNRLSTLSNKSINNKYNRKSIFLYKLNVNSKTHFASAAHQHGHDDGHHGIKNADHHEHGHEHGHEHYTDDDGRIFGKPVR